MKNLILHHLYIKVIHDIEIFDMCTEIEIAFIVNNLKTLLFLPDDEILRQGDFGNRVYFIGSGLVDIFLVQEKLKQRKTHDESILEGDFDKKEKRLTRLKEGKYFGEVALITKLKRTASAKAMDYTTLAYIDRENFAEIEIEFPQVYLNFKRQIKEYKDHDFEFRRSMVKNVPYFKDLDDEIIEEIVYLLKPHRYDSYTTIIKYGDITDRIHFLKQGEIEVTIPCPEVEAARRV